MFWRTIPCLRNKDFKFYQVYIVHARKKEMLTWNTRTCIIGISCEPMSTCANRRVHYNLTISIDTTSTWARVNTFLFNTCEVEWAIRIYSAFWFTFFKRIAEIPWETPTVCITSFRNAFCILTTWWTYTRRFSYWS